MALCFGLAFFYVLPLYLTSSSHKAFSVVVAARYHHLTNSFSLTFSVLILRWGWGERQFLFCFDCEYTGWEQQLAICVSTKRKTRSVPCNVPSNSYSIGHWTNLKQWTSGPADLIRYSIPAILSPRQIHYATSTIPFRASISLHHYSSFWLIVVQNTYHRSLNHRITLSVFVSISVLQLVNHLSTWLCTTSLIQSPSIFFVLSTSAGVFILMLTRWSVLFIRSRILFTWYVHNIPISLFAVIKHQATWRPIAQIIGSFEFFFRRSQYCSTLN